MILEIIESQKRQIELLNEKIKLLDEIVRLERESRNMWKEEALYYSQKANESLILLESRVDLLKIKNYETTTESN